MFTRYNKGKVAHHSSLAGLDPRRVMTIALLTSKKRGPENIGFRKWSKSKVDEIHFSKRAHTYENQIEYSLLYISSISTTTIISMKMTVVR